VLVVDSITKLPPDARGAVAIAASHGGVYPAYLAASAGLRGVILHDAGIGLDDAGIACLAYLDALARPAATVAHTSARIGDGRDLRRRGVISHVNRCARELGCAPGQRAVQCAERLSSASCSTLAPPPQPENRFVLRRVAGDAPVLGLDSISLAQRRDHVGVLVSGSHGGLLGGDPAAALRVAAVAAVFNDAAIGIDEAGVGRLWALDERGIPAATVDAFTARIGSARSTWETGVISRVNAAARQLGCHPGTSCRELVLACAHRR
jgi:hypothetical protein